MLQLRHGQSAATYGSAFAHAPKVPGWPGCSHESAWIYHERVKVETAHEIPYGDDQHVAKDQVGHPQATFTSDDEFPLQSGEANLRMNVLVEMPFTKWGTSTARKSRASKHPRQAYHTVCFRRSRSLWNHVAAVPASVRSPADDSETGPSILSSRSNKKLRTVRKAISAASRAMSFQVGESAVLRMSAAT
jgi:hypothetical protein